ncbi:MAG TPA: exo-alpha-sialidase [Candidatus Hydrogenedentes bacterium]|nr:exo-alpha-sialidase [Candidatus Hydrogenedentota bacterium]
MKHSAIVSWLFVGLTAMLVPATGVSAADDIVKTDLFKIGDHGYNLYHIPGIEVTAKGTVLAWCEARVNAGHDWDDIDILLRRSIDDGVTWSEAKKIVQVDGPKKKNPFALRLKPTDPNTVTYNNPVMIADRDGTVHMVFCLEYMRSFYQRSEDDGITWSKPVEITKAFEPFRKHYDWTVLATGPNHGIQLKNGRLLVPVWLSTGTGGGAHRPSVTATIFSDDAGRTWQASEIAVPCTDEFVNPNETVAVELTDGRVMLNVRNESKARRRIIVTSPDGATQWSDPIFQEDLVDPVCMAGLTRYNHGGKNLLLFSNPDTPRGRRNVTVRVSNDEGQTWPHRRSVESGFSAYSDINVTPTGAILCFYGRSEKANFAGDRLTIARFSIDWLLEGASKDWKQE